MPGLLPLKKLFKRNYFLLFLIAYFGITISATAQLADVYIQGGITYTTFLRKGDIETGQGSLFPEIGVGLGFYVNEKQTWKINAEAGIAFRQYTTVYPQSKFDFTASGLQLNALGEYPFSERISAEAGLGIYFYKIYLHENHNPKNVGDQGRTVDLNLIAGVNYKIYNPLLIGLRASFGMIPMVRVSPVGKYGEMKGKENLLNALTPEFYVRVKLYRSNKL